MVHIFSDDGHANPAGGRRRHRLLALAVLAVAVVALAAWLFLRGRAEAPPAGPKATPQAHRGPAAPPSPTAPVEREPRKALAAHPSAPATAGPLLRVEADVPGAAVFFDHKYVGTVPAEVRDFAPGAHRVNVSADGYEMYAETLDLDGGRRELMVRFKEVRLDETLEVVHRHGLGSCRGRLLATPEGLRYATEDGKDAFTSPFSGLETLEVDYLRKNLRVRLRGGRTYNFTAESADALLTFQKKVEAARKRLS